MLDLTLTKVEINRRATGRGRILWPELRFRENELKVLPFSSKIAFECFSFFVNIWRVMEIKTFEQVGAMTNWKYKNR